MRAGRVDHLADGWRELLDTWPRDRSPEAAPRPGVAKARDRLFGRVASAVEAGATFTNVRASAARATVPLAPGVDAQWLYAARRGALRPGEPQRARVLHLAPGAGWAPPPGSWREWLVLAGDLSLMAEAPIHLSSLDFHADRGDVSMAVSQAGARVYLREGAELARPLERSMTQHDEPGLWLPFAPGVRRRLMWTDGRQAAMLYATEAGASVPRHGHLHDEECLMLAGELFLDDVLLREGEYQLAPAGTEHGDVSTDTGCLLFAHGDLDLALR